MTNLVEKSLADSTKQLYKNIDNDDEVDFTIVSKEKDEFRVHSFILKLRSDVLKRMFSHDFKEKTDKTIKFSKFSSKAVKTFIKYLYGYQLNEGNEGLDLDTLKEILVMGDMYDVGGLKDVVVDDMVKFITKENVFELLDFIKQHQVKDVQKCLEFILNNFDIDELKNS